MQPFPYEPVKVDWKRPPIDRAIIKQCTQRSDLKGFAHCLGTLAILTASGSAAYYCFATKHWVWMAVTLYVHGGLFAFRPQMHEFGHGTVFKTKWLNLLFKRIFGLIHWNSNIAAEKISHPYHHRYTLHRRSEGEEVHPRAETKEQLLQSAIHVVYPRSLVMTVYDRIYSLFKPYMRNPRRGIWQRYVYSQSKRSEQIDVHFTDISQFVFHLLFAAFAIAMGKWFLIVVVSLPEFYGGKWYNMMVFDTMHVGREPETDDFKLCCRTVHLDPFTSFLYWHMEWHTEHHAYAGIPCYNLKRFHELTREHWDKPQSIAEAWDEMNVHSEKLLRIPSKEELRGEASQA